MFMKAPLVLAFGLAVLASVQCKFDLETYEEGMKLRKQLKDDSLTMEQAVKLMEESPIKDKCKIGDYTISEILALREVSHDHCEQMEYFRRNKISNDHHVRDIKRVSEFAEFHLKKLTKICYGRLEADTSERIAKIPEAKKKVVEKFMRLFEDKNNYRTPEVMEAHKTYIDNEPGSKPHVKKAQSDLLENACTDYINVINTARNVQDLVELYKIAPPDTKLPYLEPLEKIEKVCTVYVQRASPNAQKRIKYYQDRSRGIRFHSNTNPPSDSSDSKEHSDGMSSFWLIALQG